MTKKQRRLLFYSCIGLFFILSFFVALYAVGYRYDFLNNRFVKTGSFSIKTQTSASISINDRKAGDTSFFNNSFLKEGLLSREYKVGVEKNGYYGWQKTISIKEGLVSDFSSVYLVKKELVSDIIKPSQVASGSFGGMSLADGKTLKLGADLLGILPKGIKKIDKKGDRLYVLVKKSGYLYRVENDEENKKPELLSLNTEDFIFSHDNQKLTWYSKNELWVYWLEDSKLQPYKKTGDRELIMRTSELIGGIKWHAENSHLFVLIGDKIEFVELDGRGGRNSYKIYEDSGIKDIGYDKSSKKLLIKLTDRIISLEI